MKCKGKSGWSKSQVILFPFYVIVCQWNKQTRTPFYNPFVQFTPFLFLTTNHSATIRLSPTIVDLVVGTETPLLYLLNRDKGIE